MASRTRLDLASRAANPLEEGRRAGYAAVGNARTKFAQYSNLCIRKKLGFLCLVGFAPLVITLRLFQAQRGTLSLLTRSVAPASSINIKLGILYFSLLVINFGLVQRPQNRRSVSEHALLHLRHD